MSLAEFVSISAESYFKLNQAHPLEELKRRARSHRTCTVCREPEWRLGGTGLCFTCTTGEADSSNDFELVEE